MPGPGPEYSGLRKKGFSNLMNNVRWIIDEKEATICRQ
jgi:hypothetical protein